MRNLIWTATCLALLSILMINCKSECEECPDQPTDKIIVDDVDSAIVRKSEFIGIKDAEIVYVKNAKYVIVDEADKVYVANSQGVIMPRQVNAIIVDDVDSAVYEVDVVAENPIKDVIKDVQENDLDDDDDDEKKKQN